MVLGEAGPMETRMATKQEARQLNFFNSQLPESNNQSYFTQLNNSPHTQINEITFDLIEKQRKSLNMNNVFNYNHGDMGVGLRSS